MGESNPYIGPAPFERKDKEKFFGRDFEGSQLVSLIVKDLEVAIYAQSGAGKTSLINAKLIPLLEKEGFEVFSPARVRGIIPDDIDADQISNLYMFFALLNWVGKDSDARDLINLTLNDFLDQREHRKDEDGVPQLRILMFDQFEEMFTSYSARWKEREAFFKQICEALEQDPLLRVVFALREDYIARLDPYAELLPEKLKSRFHLELLRKPAAKRAIEGPVENTRRSYGEGVVELLVDELMKIRVENVRGEFVEKSGEFVEPVQIQVVCDSLWYNLEDGVTLISQEHLNQVFEVEELQHLGFVDNALFSFYNDLINKASNKHGKGEEELRLWFEDELITSMETRGVAQKPDEISDEVIKFFVDMHLIRRVQLRAGVEFYEIIHDRFIKPISESRQNREKKQQKKTAKKTG